MVKMIRDREILLEDTNKQQEVEQMVAEKDSSFKVAGRYNGEDKYLFLKHDCGLKFANKYKKIKEDQIKCPMCHN